MTRYTTKAHKIFPGVIIALLQYYSVLLCMWEGRWGAGVQGCRGAEVLGENKNIMITKRMGDYGNGGEAYTASLRIGGISISVCNGYEDF